jgi:DNA-binding NarL/FixJ family response regulator
VATIALHATLPSLRLGLTNMLEAHGHTVLPPDAVVDASVWVLDEPTLADLDALAAARYSDSPRAAVVLSDEPVDPRALRRAGLRGWASLARDADGDQLDLAVRAADAGLVLLDLTHASATLSGPSETTAPVPLDEPLTTRELQVLQLVAQGLPNKGIARRLGISDNTAKFHVASLSSKLGASSRTEAVTLAARRGLLVL